MFARIKRFGTWSCLAVLVGCASGRATVPMADLADPPDSEVYYVFTTGGEELEFVTLAATDRSLSGTVRSVQQRLVGQGEDERMESRNQYREMTLPLSDVARVEVRKSGMNPIVMIAAGAAAAGGAFLLLGGEDDNGTGTGTGGGKPPPTLP